MLDLGMTERTAADGTFSFAGVPAGTHRVYAGLIGRGFNNVKRLSSVKASIG